MGQPPPPLPPEMRPGGEPVSVEREVVTLLANAGSVHASDELKSLAAAVFRLVERAETAERELARSRSEVAWTET